MFLMKKKKFIIGAAQVHCVEKLDDNRLRRIADWFHTYYSRSIGSQKKVNKLKKEAKGQNPYEADRKIHIFKTQN